VEARKYGCGGKRRKENKMPLATEAKKSDVPRNTLRSRLTIGSVNSRQLGKESLL
jgi:hypothetical protein